MKKVFWAVLLTGVLFSGTMVTAQETSPNPTSPPHGMGPMTGMTGERGPMGSTDHMGAMMQTMQGMMQMMQGMMQMMQNCPQMSGGAPAQQPSGNR